MTDPTSIPRFKDYAPPGAAQFDRARNLFAPGFQQFDIGLGVASPAGGLILNVAGDFLYIDSDPVASNGVATLQLNAQQDAGVAKFFIQPGFAINSTFKQLRLDFAAQPGKSLRLLYSTGDRVVPAFTATTLASITIAPNNPVPVTEEGYIYGATYKSSTAMASNTPDNIIAAGSNVNGYVLWAAGGYSIAATIALVSFVAKATAPANPNDGDVLCVGIPTSSNLIDSIAMIRAVFVAAGKRLDAISNPAETSAERFANYTLR